MNFASCLHVAYLSIKTTFYSHFLCLPYAILPYTVCNFPLPQIVQCMKYYLTMEDQNCKECYYNIQLHQYNASFKYFRQSWVLCVLSHIIIMAIANRYVHNLKGKCNLWKTHKDSWNKQIQTVKRHLHIFVVDEIIRLLLLVSPRLWKNNYHDDCFCHGGFWRGTDEIIFA